MCYWEKITTESSFKQNSRLKYQPQSIFTMTFEKNISLTCICTVALLLNAFEKKVNKGTNNDTCWEECSCRGHLVSEMQRTHDHLQSIQRKLYDKIEEPSKTESFN